MMHVEVFKVTVMSGTPGAPVQQHVSKTNQLEWAEATTVSRSLRHKGSDDVSHARQQQQPLADSGTRCGHNDGQLGWKMRPHGTAFWYVQGCEFICCSALLC
jgi:hypothetical protein